MGYMRVIYVLISDWFCLYDFAISTKYKLEFSQYFLKEICIYGKI
jgi:hypothetical protein